MFSSAQHQLLQLLKIQPLRLRSQFIGHSDATVVPSPDPDDGIASVSQRQIPDSSHVLCQDIASLFQQTPVNAESSLKLGPLHWFIDNDATASLLTENELITPPLTLLQQPALKQQLWQQLSHYFEQL